MNKDTGAVHVEIRGLKTPTSTRATRICMESLNEVIAGFIQDKLTLEQGALSAFARLCARVIDRLVNDPNHFNYATFAPQPAGAYARYVEQVVDHP